MTPKDISSIARVPFDAFNDRDFDRVSPFIAPTATFTDKATGDVRQGPAGFRDFQTTWAAGFPDGTVTITRLLTGEDFAVVEYTGRGTHTGPFETPMGTIPPTNRPGELSLVDIYEIRSGKITSGVTYYDAVTLLRQLGIAPAVAAPARQPAMAR